MHQAEDYTQAFFARLLEKGNLKQVDPARGKFRTFLLASLKNFLSDEWDLMRALKRGGNKQALPFEITDAETRLFILCSFHTGLKPMLMLPLI